MRLFLLVGVCLWALCSGAQAQRQSLPWAPHLNSSDPRLSSKWCDIVADEGADPTGVADTTPALNACVATGHLTVIVQNGIFNFKTHFIPPSNFSLFARPHFVTFKLDPSNRSAQIVYVTSVSNVTFSGVTFDGNSIHIDGLPLSNMIRVEKADRVVLKDSTFQNTNRSSVYFSDYVTDSGVENSYFNNIGTLWASERLVTALGCSAASGATTLTCESTTGVVAGRVVAGDGIAANTVVRSGVTSTLIPLSAATKVVIRSQSISFIAPLSDAAQALNFGTGLIESSHNHGNFSHGNSFTNIGADSIDALSQANFDEQQDSFDLALRGWHPAAASIGLTVGVGCFYGLGSSNLHIEGNHCHGATGSGYDLPITGGLTFLRNECSDNGSAGLALVGIVDGALISGNSCKRNNRGLHYVYKPLRRAGISLGIGARSILSNITIGPNDLGDDQATPTQDFAIDASGNVTFNNIEVDPRIKADGVVIAPFSPTALEGLGIAKRLNSFGHN